jgi:sarcosine oxidase
LSRTCRCTSPSPRPPNWFEPSVNTEQLAPGRFPIYILQRQDTHLIYGFPFMAGKGIKVAKHHSKINTTLEEIDRQVAPAEVADMQRIFGSFVPDGAGAHRKSAVCFYTNTPDDHFIVGLHPQHPQVVLAGGFSGHGFKFASVLGEVLADLAITGGTRHPVGFLTPSRFG